MRASIIVMLLILPFGLKAAEHQLSFEDVKRGKGLATIQEMPLGIMFDRWVNSGSVGYRITLLGDQHLHLLYRDTNFTYFGFYNMGVFKSETHFFKVNTFILESEFPGYKEFQGYKLNTYLWHQMPDRERMVGQNIKKQGKPDIVRDNYEYRLRDKKVFLYLKQTYKRMNGRKCHELKEYCAYYDLVKKEFKMTNCRSVGF